MVTGSNKQETNINILKIVLPIMATLLLQTISGVWWASGVEQRLVMLETSNKEVYYKSSALARNTFVDHRFNALETTVSIIVKDFKDAVVRIENKIDKYFRPLE